MGTLPQLIEDDVSVFNACLRELLQNTEANAALIIDKGGFLITSEGNRQEFDLTTIAALASGAYLANQTIANLVHESHFNSVYQQGERSSMFILSVDEHSLLVVIFPVQVSIGLVKYFAMTVGEQIAAQMRVAKSRDPGLAIDLSEYNLADASELFKRKS